MFPSSMAHVENHDLGVIGIDSVKDEIRVANGWKHADAGFIGEMTSLGKILEEVGNGLMRSTTAAAAVRLCS